LQENLNGRTQFGRFLIGNRYYAYLGLAKQARREVTMGRSTDNVETRIERMSFDALKNECDTVLEDWKSKGVAGSVLADRAGDPLIGNRLDLDKAPCDAVTADDGSGVGDVMKVLEARIHHLEQKLLAMHDEHRKYVRQIKHGYWVGIVLTISLTVIVVGGRLAIELM
jgi:hypothetical protein